MDENGRVTIDDINGPDPLDVALAGEGITPEWWAKHMKGKVESAMVTKTATDKGKITDEKEYEDNRVRLDALIQLGRAAGYYAPDRHEFNVKGNLTINMDFGETEKKGDG